MVFEVIFPRLFNVFSAGGAVWPVFYVLVSNSSGWEVQVKI